MPLQQFEYKIEEISGDDDIVTGLLNHEGRYGWELVGMGKSPAVMKSGRSFSGRFIFKRSLSVGKFPSKRLKPQLPLPDLIEL